MFLTAMFKITYAHARTRTHTQYKSEKLHVNWNITFSKFTLGKQASFFLFCYSTFQNLLGFRVYPWPNTSENPSTRAILRSTHDRTLHSGLLCFWKEQNHFPVSCMRYYYGTMDKAQTSGNPIRVPYTNTFNTEVLPRMLSHLFASRFLSKHF